MVAPWLTDELISDSTADFLRGKHARAVDVCQVDDTMVRRQPLLSYTLCLVMTTFLHILHWQSSVLHRYWHS